MVTRLHQQFLTKSKYLIHQSAWKACNNQGLDISASYVNDDVSSDEEMGNSNFVGATSLDASDLHYRILADTASRRKLKAREAFTIPFPFLCDYADQSDQHMSFMARMLKILKDEIAVFHEKTNRYQSIQRVKNCRVWVSVVFH
jgi:hypothetical protein